MQPALSLARAAGVGLPGCLAGRHFGDAQGFLEAAAEPTLRGAVYRGEEELLRYRADQALMPTETHGTVPTGSWRPAIATATATAHGQTGVRWHPQAEAAQEISLEFSLFGDGFYPYGYRWWGLRLMLIISHTPCPGVHPRSRHR